MTKPLIAAACLLLAAFPSASNAQAGAGNAAAVAVTTDPLRDEAHPARNRQLVIPSGPVRPELGRPAEMNALFFLASGAGPKPTLLLLHGLPGNERNLDLAQAVRRAGWNVLTFTYRGAWGSEGTFSIQHAIADAEAALAFVRRPDVAGRYGVDTARIVMAGHSMGGYMAAYTVAHDWPASPFAASASHAPAKKPGQPPLAGLILLDAWDIGADAAKLRSAGAEGRARFIEAFDDIGHALGPITAADIADSLIRRGEEWHLAPLAGAFARLPVLNIAASEGNAKEMQAFSAAIGRESGAKVTHTELATDHSFADKRIALASQVVRWLEALPRD